MKPLRDWSLHMQLLVLPLTIGIVISWVGLFCFLVIDQAAKSDIIKAQKSFERLNTKLQLLASQNVNTQLTEAAAADFRQALSQNFASYNNLLNSSYFSSITPNESIHKAFQRLDNLLTTSPRSQSTLSQSALSKEAQTLSWHLGQLNQIAQQQNSATIRTAFWVAIAIMLFAAVVALMIVIPAIRRTTRTIKSLHQASIDISEGRDEADLPIDSENELGQLVQAFNHMHTRLREEETNTKTMVKALEKAKEEADNARQLQAEFFSNMSHELRTPMHAILNFANIGESKVEKVSLEKSRHYFSRIAISGRRLLKLLDDLLDIAKLEADQMSFEISMRDLKDTVESAIAELESLLRERQLKIRIRSADVNTEARFDPDKIFQVATNLLSNAIKFSPEGKTITITYHADTLKQGRRRSDTGRLSAVRVTVSDEGTGIPEDELEQVFSKFFQSSRTKNGAGGTGLGLAICREIIEKHGGMIMAENNPDIGCSFSFLLPREPSIISVENAPPE